MFRSCIERCFGILKARFRLLQTPLVLGKFTEIWEVLYACIALHNFIRLSDASVDTEIELQALLTNNLVEGIDVNFDIEELHPLQGGTYNQARTHRAQIAQHGWQLHLQHYHH